MYLQHQDDENNIFKILNMFCLSHPMGFDVRLIDIVIINNENNLLILQRKFPLHPFRLLSIVRPFCV